MEDCASAAKGLDACGLIPTRTFSTELHYSETARGLIARSEPDSGCDDFERFAHVIPWFLSQHGSWAAATIRAYRAALLFSLDQLRASGLDEHQADSFQLALTGAPAARSRRARPQTIARKRRGFTLIEHAELIDHLREKQGMTSRLVLGLIRYGPAFGLRPCEWLTTEVRDNKLIVQCAKRTNGRGFDDERIIDLGWQPPLCDGLDNFLSDYKCEAATAPSLTAFYERLAKALRRACIKLRIPIISFYTVRHQALATAKRSMMLEEVAAFAGHRTTRTTSRNYAKRRSGWSIVYRVKPSLESILKVEIAPRTAFRELIDVDLTSSCITAPPI